VVFKKSGAFFCIKASGFESTEAHLPLTRPSDFTFPLKQAGIFVGVSTP
jgi:hypothetical protein